MSRHFFKNKRILLTAGPTWAAIDDVRVLSNISSGELGMTLAIDLARQGARVTLLLGPVEGAKPSGRQIRCIRFRFFEELFDLLKIELKKKYDIVIHAAAVSDYRPQRKFKQKINSQQKKLTLDLVPTPKIISLIKKWQPETKLVGFKLESFLTENSARKKSQELFQTASCDLVVANWFQKGSYHGLILDKGSVLARAAGREGIAKELLRILERQVTGLENLKRASGARTPVRR